MATDWFATLHEQGELVKRLAATVTEALDHPDLTLDLASRIYREVEQGAQAFDAIAQQMDISDVPTELFEAAEALENIWVRLSIAAANKVRTMRGLSPLEFPDDDDNE